MLYISTADEMRLRDQAAIESGIPGIVLMENAGLRVTEAVQKNLFDTLTGLKAVILCGPGNNGGDGFVTARQLRRLGACVHVCAFAGEASFRGNAAVNAEAWRHSGGKIEYILDKESIASLKTELDAADLIVDAMLGTGLSRPVQGVFFDAITMINQSRCPVVSVDIPSGVDSDYGRIMGTAVKADLTVTFALYKRGMLLYPGAGYTGKVVVGDICFPSHIAEQATGVYLFTREDAVKLYPHRRPDAHKGSSGKVVLAAGSAKYPGAAVLSAASALRGGAGLVYLFVPASLKPLLEQKLTEVIVAPLPESEDGTFMPQGADILLQHANRADAIAVGPGLSKSSNVKEFIEAVLPNVKIPVVVDADGLNSLAEDITMLKSVSAPVVLTPHPGEMSRLTGLPITEIINDRIGIASKYAKEWNVTLVLKGAPTVTAASSGEVYINSSGSAALATAGTGDVLTGQIAALLAAGLEPASAAALGVYLHGRAGEEAQKQRVGGVIAGDVVQCLGMPL